MDVGVGRDDDDPGVQDGAGGDVHLAQRGGDLEHPILGGRIHPAVHEQDARVVAGRNLRGVFRGVGEDGEDGLVVVVEADAEHRRLVEQNGDHAVLEAVVETAAGGEDGVALHVLADGDVDAHGLAGEGELAEAAVDVAAARTPGERRLLAVVVDGDGERLAALLRDGNGIGVVALDLRRVFGVLDEFGGGSCGGHRGGKEGEFKVKGGSVHGNLSFG